MMLLHFCFPLNSRRRFCCYVAMILHHIVLQIKGRNAGVQQVVPLEVACCIDKAGQMRSMYKRSELQQEISATQSSLCENPFMIQHTS